MRLKRNNCHQFLVRPFSFTKKGTSIFFQYIDVAIVACHIVSQGKGIRLTCVYVCMCIYVIIKFFFIIVWSMKLCLLG